MTFTLIAIKLTGLRDSSCHGNQLRRCMTLTLLTIKIQLHLQLSWKPSQNICDLDSDCKIYSRCFSCHGNNHRRSMTLQLFVKFTAGVAVVMETKPPQKMYDLDIDHKIYSKDRRCHGNHLKRYVTWTLIFRIHSKDYSCHGNCLRISVTLTLIVHAILNGGVQLFHHGNSLP